MLGSHFPEVAAVIQRGYKDLPEFSHLLRQSHDKNSCLPSSQLSYPYSTVTQQAEELRISHLLKQCLTIKICQVKRKEKKFVKLFHNQRKRSQFPPQPTNITHVSSSWSLQIIWNWRRALKIGPEQAIPQSEEWIVGKNMVLEPDSLCSNVCMAAN